MHLKLILPVIRHCYFFECCSQSVVPTYVGQWLAADDGLIDYWRKFGLFYLYSPTPVVCTSVIRTQFRTWSLFKKYGILTKIADSATEQSTCVCVSYVHVQYRHTVVRHRVQCEV